MTQGLKLLALCLFVLVLQACQDRVRRYSYTVEGIEIGGYPVVFKEIPEMQYIYQEVTLNKSEVKAATRDIATQIMQTVGGLQGLDIIGPLTYQIPALMNNAGDSVHMNVGFPVNTVKDSANANFKILEPFDCITVRIPVDDEYTKTMWFRLNQVAYREGYQPTGEGRTVITFNDTGSNYVMELQLGIAKKPAVSG